MRSDSRKRKSCTSVPSRVTAWARMPAVYGKQVDHRQARTVLAALPEVRGLEQRAGQLGAHRFAVAREHPPEPGEEQVLRDVAQVDGELPISLARQAEHGVRAHRHAAVDHAREMDAEEGEVGVRDRIDQAPDDVVLLARQSVVLAAEGDDLVRDRQPREARQAIGLQPGAGDERPAVQLRAPARTTTSSPTRGSRSPRRRARSRRRPPGSRAPSRRRPAR